MQLGLGYVEKYLNNKYNTSLEVKFYSSKEEQANYLRLGIANGITQEMIKSTKIRWQGWVEETIYEWGERTRVGSGDLVVQYLEDWWNEVTS